MDDIEEIKKLKARYFRALDAQDWELYASVFAPDVVVDTTRGGGELVRGASHSSPMSANWASSSRSIRAICPRSN